MAWDRATDTQDGVERGRRLFASAHPERVQHAGLLQGLPTIWEVVLCLATGPLLPVTINHRSIRTRRLVSACRLQLAIRMVGRASRRTESSVSPVCADPGSRVVDAGLSYFLKLACTWERRTRLLRYDVGGFG